MCSIAGAVTRKEVEKMLKLQKHRAPDGNGIVEKGNFVMGMGRLAIIDLKSPNLSPHVDGDYVLSFNGEVYNYLDIKKELELKGYRFATKSDTEVVLKAYIHWGKECLNKFNGMFAIAIYDGSKNELFLARDIAGQKPLFYRTKDFAFASEAKALVNGDTRVREDYHFETFEHIHTNSLYENIHQLLPAHYLIRNMTTGKTVISRYWEFQPIHINPNTALEELEYLLEDAIKLTQQSDVPYTLYYSGGVDSALIKDFGHFKEGLSFTEDKDTEADFAKNLPKIVKHLDFPVGSFSSYPLFKLAQEAKKKGFKVVLSGEGADEIFGGYVRYLPIATFQEMCKKYPSYMPLFKKNRWPSYVAITARNEGREYLQKLMEPLFSKYDPVTAMQMFDFTYILPSLLQMGDRMASAFGIENRCPFLDKRLIEFGLSLPIGMKISNLETKVLLRKLLRKRWLKEQNEKHGLTISFNKWHGIEGFDRTKYFSLLKEEWRKQNL